MNQLNLFCTNSNALVLHYLFWQLSGLYSYIFYRKNHKVLLWDKIRPNLLSFIKLTFYAFHSTIILRILTETPDWKKKSFTVKPHLNCTKKEFYKVYLDSNDEISNLE